MMRVERHRLGGLLRTISWLSLGVVGIVSRLIEVFVLMIILVLIEILNASGQLDDAGLVYEISECPNDQNNEARRRAALSQHVHQQRQLQ